LPGVLVCCGGCVLPDGAGTVVVSVIVNVPEGAVGAVDGGRTIVDQSSPVIGC